jgi:probable DNA metabolism protein
MTGQREVSPFDAWRAAVRPWLSAGRAADQLGWSDLLSRMTVPVSDIAEDHSVPAVNDTLRLPRSLMTLLQTLACFRHGSRWEFMYRLAWRVLYQNSQLLTDPADPDVANALSMERAVRRDLHKMHAFVRFREIAGEVGTPAYFAWFEPQHEILRPGADFFVERFPNMLWTIATPDGAAVWDTVTLRFVASPSIADRPRHDSHEDLWRTYYRSICNVARINPSAMQREMPQHYWKNLPEAGEIATLVREGSARLTARSQQGDNDKFAAAKSLQRSLAQAKAGDEGGLQKCRACDLWRHATQAVQGEGPAGARLMLVGEQPGDEEDLQGRPFIGPAGKLLSEVLRSAGISREDIFITNAVKHFKWEPRGKRRLHKRPNVGEIRACNHWLQGEVDSVKPMVIVALGASALSALSGGSQSIEAARAGVLTYRSGATLLASYHPSAILRADADRAAVLRAALLEDLQRAVALLTAPPLTIGQRVV